jgi:hypothetical protein
LVTQQADRVDSASAQTHQAGLEISQRLADADPGNARAQRDLSVSHKRSTLWRTVVD